MLFLVVRAPVLVVVHNMLPGVVSSVVPCGLGTGYCSQHTTWCCSQCCSLWFGYWLLFTTCYLVLFIVVPCGSGTSTGYCSQHATGCCSLLFLVVRDQYWLLFTTCYPVLFTVSFLVVRVPAQAIVHNMLPGVFQSVVPCGSGTSTGCCSQHSTGCC